MPGYVSCSCSSLQMSVCALSRGSGHWRLTAHLPNQFYHGHIVNSMKRAAAAFPVLGADAACAHTPRAQPCAAIRLLRSRTLTPLTNAYRLDEMKKSTIHSADPLLPTNTASCIARTPCCAQRTNALLGSGDGTPTGPLRYDCLALRKCFLGDESRQLPRVKVTQWPSGGPPSPVNAPFPVTSSVAAAARAAAAMWSPACPTGSLSFAAVAPLKAPAIAQAATAARVSALRQPFGRLQPSRASLLQLARQHLAPLRLLSSIPLNASRAGLRPGPAASWQQQRRCGSQAASALAKANKEAPPQLDIKGASEGRDQLKLEVIRGKFLSQCQL